MSEPEKCRHRKLTFGSGGFYVICADACGQYWVAKHGQDDEPGLRPESANDLTHMGDLRVEPPILDRLAMVPDEQC
jgi:hypothetical protein